MRLYVAVCNFPYTGLRPAADVQFPELLELGLCSVGLCEVDLDRVLAGSPKLEKLAFVCGRVALTRIDLASPRLRCVLFWHAAPSHQLAVVDAPRLERIILWEEDAYSKTPAKIKIGSAPLLRAIGYLNPTLHVLQIGDELIMVRMCSQISNGLFIILSMLLYAYLHRACLLSIFFIFLIRKRTKAYMCSVRSLIH